MAPEPNREPHGWRSWRAPGADRPGASALLHEALAGCETSATASGKSTRIASRRAIVCSSIAPVGWTCLSAAAVSSTAVFRVSVANCSRWAPCTDSACCSANSRKPAQQILRIAAEREPSETAAFHAAKAS